MPALLLGEIDEEAVLSMWSRGAAVTVEAAAVLAGVDAAAIRRWLAIRLLVVERRGDLQAVSLQHLEVLMGLYPHRERVSDAELEWLMKERLTNQGGVDNGYGPSREDVQ
jgi:hypothetical protein